MSEPLPEGAASDMHQMNDVLIESQKEESISGLMASETAIGPQNQD